MRPLAGFSAFGGTEDPLAVVIACYTAINPHAAGNMKLAKLAAQLSNKEVMVLAEALAEFHRLVFCGVCRVSVGKHGEDDWRCGCEALKYQKAA